MTAKIVKNKIIWVLVDHRPGTANQAISLADALQRPYEIKHLKYNKFFDKIPNVILQFYPFHVNKSIINNLKESPAPDIIISAGRKAAAVAVYINKYFNYSAKIIQIMRPCVNFNLFSLVIVPQHDSRIDGNVNVVHMIGSLSGIHSKFIAARENFISKYPEMHNFIAVIIGGSSKNYDFSIHDGKELAEKLHSLAQNHSLPFFISFSRRTPELIKNLFKEEFLWPHIIFDPQTQDDNPYPGMIAAANYIITTSDSISICSEAVATGKPVYAFCPNNFHLKKHRFFLQQLIDLQMIRLLSDDVNALEHYSYKPLNELSRITSIVKKECL